MAGTTKITPIPIGAAAADGASGTARRPKCGLISLELRRRARRYRCGIARAAYPVGCSPSWPRPS